MSKGFRFVGKISWESAVIIRLETPKPRKRALVLVFLYWLRQLKHYVDDSCELPKFKHP